MADTIYNFMKLRNRPYSLNDLVSNLHNEHGKTAVQKALDLLVNEGKIREKVYGKQKVYFPVQDTSRSVDELLRKDRELQARANEVEKELQRIETEIKVQEALLESVKSSITVEEAREQKAALEERVKTLNQKLDGLRVANGTEDLSERRKKAEDTLKVYSREYAKRKRLCTDMLDCILDNYPGSRTELFEEIGIEFKNVT